MTDSRWVRVSVEVFNHEILDKGPFDRRSAWLWLIAHAAWKDKRVNHKGRPLEIKRGQVIAGRDHLAEVWGWSPKQVRNFLELLCSENMLEKGQSNGHYANVFLVVNYDTYQNVVAIDDQRKGQSRASAGPEQGQTLTRDTSNTNTNLDNSAQQTTPRAKIVAALPKVEELDQLRKRLLDAAGSALTNRAIAPALDSLLVPQMWIDQGCDLDRDILPAVRDVAGRRKQGGINAWDYFTKAVHEFRDKRRAGMPTAAPIKPIPAELTPEELAISREHSRAAIRAAQARIGASQCAQSETSPTSTDWPYAATATAASTSPVRSAQLNDRRRDENASASVF